MELRVAWMQPIPLTKSKRRDRIYDTDLDRIPNVAGVYVLGRVWGTSFEALYVGKADNLKRRVDQHLNNLRLMRHLEDAQKGSRVVMIGTFMAKQNQPANVCLPLIEKALIRHFLAEGHDLVNAQGTRRRQHEIVSLHRPMRFVPSTIGLEKSGTMPRRGTVDGRGGSSGRRAGRAR
ncbi:MAG: GIY-YIG nuclease family protein [Microbacterium sp.]